MNRRIAVFTGTRADYGLLYWLMRDIQASDRLELQVIVSGAHLSPEFGSTWQRIDADGFPVSAKVEMLLSADTASAVVKSMGLGLIGFADALERLAPDLLVVLGDRYEALAIAQAALIQRIPLAHIHGGELTAGAYDDAIRHAITKLAGWHFVAAEPYRQRVIQMGEAPERVFNVGALGLDLLSRSSRMSLAALRQSLGFDLRPPYFLVTYHPETLEDAPAEAAFRELLAALDRFPEMQVLLTYPNADNGAHAIIALLENYAQARPDRVVAVRSLGLERYLAAASAAAAVVGNSSSGLIEIPALGVPTVNIGTRQQGRLQAPSVLNCRAVADDVEQALLQALTPEHQALSRQRCSPYGQGDAARAIVRVLEQADLSLLKTFHDLEPS